jgi:hypothetical protein
MPQITALTIDDGAATPVAHTFGPVTTNGSKAKFADRSAGVASGYRTIEDEVRLATTPTGANRRVINFMLPVTAVVDGVTKVVRYNSAQVILNQAQDATEQENKDQLAYVKNYIDNALVKAAVPQNEPWY